MTHVRLRFFLPITLLTVAAVAVMLSGRPAAAQMSAEELVMRLERMENQVRQLTGTIEQLQYRNQQLDQALKRMQEDNEFRFQELGGKGGARPAAPQRPMAAQPPPAQPQYQAPPAPQPQYQQPQPQYQQPAPAGSGRRSDAFDPNQNPAAPGAPRVLGTTAPSEPLTAAESSGIGAPGGRDPGTPLDLSTLSANASRDPALASGDGALPPPPARSPSATGMRTAALPAATPRDEFDQAYNAMLRKDYAGAEAGFRTFLQKNSGDRLAPDAQYWLGESMFQRQNWREAADAFLSMSKTYEKSPKAAEALLRLGQSLAMLREKELSCATFGEIQRKYPRASTTIKQAVEREQKRLRC
jgi:tol-pal system protein YbgF